jgi:threonine dehydratase
MCRKVVLKGNSLVESIEVARQMAVETERLFVHPYDDEEIMAGQGLLAWRSWRICTMWILLSFQ